MKRFLTTVLFLALAANVFAYPEHPVARTTGGWSASEGKARPFAVTATGAMVVTTEGTTGLTVATMPAVTVSLATITAALASGTNSVGSVTVIIPSTGSQSVTLLSSSDFVVTAFAKRKYVSLSATGTFEYTIGAATVVANTTPCYNVSFEADPTLAIAVKTTATGTYLTIRQWGN